MKVFKKIFKWFVITIISLFVGYLIFVGFQI